MLSDRYKYRYTNTKTHKYKHREIQLQFHDSADGELQYKMRNNGSDSVRQIQIYKYKNIQIQTHREIQIQFHDSTDGEGGTSIQGAEQWER